MLTYFVEYIQKYKIDNLPKIFYDLYILMQFRRFKFYPQLDKMDCGPTCLKMIAKYYGYEVSLEYLRSQTEYGKQGVSLLGLKNAAESIRFSAIGAQLHINELISNTKLPAIIYWDNKHYVVLIRVFNRNLFLIADPAKGIILINKCDFESSWLIHHKMDVSHGIALIVEPPKDNININLKKDNRHLWFDIFNLLGNSKIFLFKLLFAIVLGSLLQLTLPFLAQNIVDKGIKNHNLNFIKLVVLGQLVILFSQTAVDYLRNRMLFYISSRLNISLLSKFWTKLLNLPLNFFSTKNTGDILQRISDQKRIERFLTGSSINLIFSLFNLLLFSFVLFTYNIKIFLIYFISSSLYIYLVKYFLYSRKLLDYDRFTIMAKENEASIQLISGIQEIKLYNAENIFRRKWEYLQSKIYEINYKTLSINQYQQIFSFLINQGKNIFITYIVAKEVLEGKLTLGIMISVQYIIGQLNSPIEQIIGFTQQAQDTNLSLQRVNDISSIEDEERKDKEYKLDLDYCRDIFIENLYFKYPGAGNDFVLKNISIVFPENKVTAIVGASGSGKSTIFKLLLQFYINYSGKIFIGKTSLNNISPSFWRSKCGVIMQESFVFNDTILNNITMNDVHFEMDKVKEACNIANLLDYIETLPLGFNTVVGSDGIGMSGGQKQRLTIARAVYRNPDYILFDEATNSLDSKNEKLIMENLRTIFINRTVIIIAHRLSTILSADKIIVMNDGMVIEQGTHHELLNLGGKYCELVKNQFA